MYCHSQRRMQLKDYIYIYIYKLYTVTAGTTLSTRLVLGCSIQDTPLEKCSSNNGVVLCTHASLRSIHNFSLAHRAMIIALKPWAYTEKNMSYTLVLANLEGPAGNNGNSHQKK